VRPSMGSVGDAYDNAMAESCFASLECELLDRRTFHTKTEARLAVFTWIEAWYNPRRRHSALGYQSPMNFERSHQHARPAGGRHDLPPVGVSVACATPPGDIHGRPQFARLCHADRQARMRIAGIHPTFRRARRFGPDGNTLAGSSTSLRARWLVIQRQVRPAPVLPILPSTIDCQSNPRREIYGFHPAIPSVSRLGAIAPTRRAWP
jgi:hypothetical protein